MPRSVRPLRSTPQHRTAHARSPKPQRCAPAKSAPDEETNPDPCAKHRAISRNRPNQKSRDRSSRGSDTRLPLRMPTVPFRLRRRRLPPLPPPPQHPPRPLPHLRLPLPLPVAPLLLLLHLPPLLLPLLNNGSWRGCNGRSAATWRAPGLKRSASDRPDQHHCKVNLKKDDIARGLGSARTTNQPTGDM